ncbi:flavin reductase [Streptosporangium sp. NPDC051022]|uniref:flavin reductase n=1 Tax=Streptosporangium sp. NPDC051022 TaxID=3155752 RepID=UPI00342D636D
MNARANAVPGAASDAASNVTSDVASDMASDVASDAAALADSFRHAAGRFASGVTVVTTRNGDHLYGITATSFVSLSMNPLLVAVSINSHSPFLDEVNATGCFAVSVLASGQRDVSQYFSTRGRGRAEGAFPGVGTRTERTGAPVVSACLSWFDTRLHAILPGGDHQILIGEVVAAGGTENGTAGPGGTAGNGTAVPGGTEENGPLLYWAGGYRRLDPDDQGTPARVEAFADALSARLHEDGLSPSELIEAQRALEPAAAELAAFRRLPEGLAALKRAIDGSRVAASTPERFTEESVRFHAALGMASGNPAIAASLHSLARSRHAHYSTGTNPEATRRALAAHQEIYDAIAAGDAVRAREAMTAHLAVVSKRLCCPAEPAETQTAPQTETQTETQTVTPAVPSTATPAKES